MTQSENSPMAVASGIPAPDDVRSILVCQLRQIGDVLLSTPSIELLARRFPKARIHVLTENKCMPMLEDNPHIHRIWPIDKQALRLPWKALAYYWQVANNNYDLVVDFQQLPRCLAVVALTRAKVRLSYPPPWYRRPFYTHWSDATPCYAAAYKAAVLKPLGITWQGERPKLYLTGEERDFAKGFLASLGLAPNRFFSFDTTHKHNTRRWPLAHYAELITLMAERYPDYGFFLSYGPGEKEGVDEVIRLCQTMGQNADRVKTYEKAISLRQLCACMEQSVMHVGNCSSPRHIAVALGLPTMTILGSSSTGWSFPAPEHGVLQARAFMDMPCQPCNKHECRDNAPCLYRITPQMAFAAIEGHIGQFCILDK
ncbi:glycosyltransferase family 9 protein [Desulfovibrio sp. OttesenSCG-928-G15]|nr:glycosyltransferase family 9 protein [Desulfovibrio sp. OttesenSCG-928-G15]